MWPIAGNPEQDLYYRLNGGAWLPYSDVGGIEGDGGDALDFALDVNGTSGEIEDKDLFSYDSADASINFVSVIDSSNAENPSPLANDYYSVVQIAWYLQGNKLQLSTMSNSEVNDGYAAPIGSSAMLLGSGVFGLLLISARRMRYRD
jgi:hypothetical protein